MYRKRKAARLMFDSLELKESASKKQSSPQEPAASKPSAVPAMWMPVSSVDSFSNTSYAAGERAARPASVPFCMLNRL